MLKINNVEYRNLQEQVLKNQIDIEALNNRAEMSDLGIHIVTAEPFTQASELPLPYDGQYGDAFLVGLGEPYSLYIWTRESNEYNGEWFNWGVLNAPSIVPGPVGPQGPQGQQGTRGSTWSSQTGAPTNIVGQNTYDQALDTSTGNVYQFVNGVWQLTGNIKGPKGDPGTRGIDGSRGPQGPQGPQGPKGDSGQFIEVLGTLDNTDQLPDPTTVARSAAYLVNVGGIEHFYLIIGEGTSESPLVWHDAGAFDAGGGSDVTLQGVKQAQVELGNTLVRSPTYTVPSNLSISRSSGDAGIITIWDLQGTALNRGGGNTTNTVKFELPITNSDEIRPDSINGNRIVFRLSDTYKQSVTNSINAAKPQSITLNVPTTATSGQLTTDDLTVLQASNNNYIMFNNELYRLQDNQHDSGYLVYTHVGYDNTISDYIIKCITITVSTRGWVLTSNKLPTFSLSGDVLTIRG